MLDERLAQGARLYEPCSLGADIGTDHALLPCYLLRSNICQRMILADVSPKALRHAQEQVDRQGLNDRVELVCADGLDALTALCGCVSIMGMGGETIARILTRGQKKLRGAVLVLSAHTDLPMVRQAILDIGYHITREELCRAAGRFYVVWRAEAGAAALSDQDVRFGPLLLKTDSPLLADYIRWRAAVLTDKLDGLRSAASPDKSAIASLEEDIRYYKSRLEE